MKQQNFDVSIREWDSFKKVFGPLIYTNSENASSQLWDYRSPNVTGTMDTIVLIVLTTLKVGGGIFTVLLPT